MAKKNYSNYTKHHIKPGWNHVLYPTVKSLKLSEIDEQVLQAICKFNGRLVTYTNTDGGVPTAIYKQIGRIPSKKELGCSMFNLQEMGYVQFVDTTDGQRKNERITTFLVNKLIITRDAEKMSKDGTLEDIDKPLDNELFPKL